MIEVTLEEGLRYVHMHGCVYVEDAVSYGPLVVELLARKLIKVRDMALAAALVALAGAEQPERAAEAASSVLNSESKFFNLTEDGYVYLEARRPDPPHCGQVREWTCYCHGIGRCACICVNCRGAQKFEDAVKRHLGGYEISPEWRACITKKA